MFAHSNSTRVVVTGLGVATSLGLHVEPMWNAILAGRSGVGYIRQFDSATFPVRIGSEIDVDLFPRGGGYELLLAANRSLRFGSWAAAQAWKDAGLDAAHALPGRAGVCAGAGGFPAMESRIAARPLRKDAAWDSAWLTEVLQERPELLCQHQLSTVSSLLTEQFDLRGPSVTIQGACTSGTQAIGEACALIRSGRADIMLAGGADSMMSMFCVAGFTLLGALSTHPDPETASRPFDLTRSGFVLGEGAAMAVLESLPSALARGTRIYAEVVGYGSSCDGYRFTDVHPEGSGAVRAMRKALAAAGWKPENVDYINAHGTSTPQNDRVETMAVKTVFGDHAYRVPMSSTKSQLGHLICAAGAIEFVLTVLTLKTGGIPATINLHRADPECDLDYVPLESRRTPVRCALSNSFGFGGQNGSIAVCRWD